MWCRWGGLDYEPFEPVVKDGYLIGRGAQDNKGPAVAMLYVMRCIRELGLPAAHELCLFAGCDEERGCRIWSITRPNIRFRRCL